MDRRCGAQWHVVHQFMGDCGVVFLCSRSLRHQRIVLPVSGRGWAVRLGQGSFWRFSRIRGGMDVLDLHGVLFSGIAAGERIHERVHPGRGRDRALPESLVFDPRFAWADADCGAAEHYWLKHRKVAAECRWGGDVFAADDAGGSSGAGVPEAWVGDAFHPGEHEAYLELGYGELLVADRVCVYRARIGFRDERGGALIALMYIVGTFAILMLAPAGDLDPQSGVFHAITIGSIALKVGFLGILAALLVTVGNAGGVGSTVAGIARVPFVVGIDRYLPAAFGKIHPRWKTPYVSILVQAGVSGAILL